MSVKGHVLLVAGVICLSLLSTGCGTQADLALKFAADDVVMYKATDHWVQSLKFEQPSLGKLNEKKTETDVEIEFLQRIKSVDEQGNLYVAAGLHSLREGSETLDTRPGIHVFSPQGELLAYRETPMDSVTNCTFGGDDLKTLYVTAGRHLLAGRSIIAGNENYRPFN